MILIPIGRDDAEIRRHAWVSYVIVALNVLVFVATMTAERQSKILEINREWQKALTYNLQHPYLRTPDAMREVLRADALQYLQMTGKGMQLPPPAVVAREQRVLDGLTSSAVAVYRRLPALRFGYIPAEGGVLRLLTSMFIHAGFLHLLGNLLFFYLSGPFIEDVFGRPLFAALYVTGGIAASLTYAARHPNATIPLVGASGAIAAVMGAYLVRFLRSKVEFLFIPILFRPTLHVRFFAPAFVVLPLWLGQQVLELRSEAGGGGVAVSAHIGGFLFGVAVALIVKATSFEEKFVNPVVEQETTWVMDERVVRAMAARDVSDYDTAKRELSSALRDDPRSIDALQTAIDVARATGDIRMYDGSATRLLSRYLEEQHDDLATTLIHEITADRDAALPKFLARAANFAERKGDRQWALSLYQRMVAADPNAPAVVGSLVKIGTLLRLSGDTHAARETFAKARAHPACTAEWAPTIDAKIAALSS